VQLKGLCGWSWASLGSYETVLRLESYANYFGASVGGLGPLLGPLRAVLGRSWGLCGRSSGALGSLFAVLGASASSRGPGGTEAEFRRHRRN
jgi:hypothetical protein